MNEDLKVRLGGVFLVVAGGVLGWLSIWRPYQAALAGSASVSLNTKGIALAVLFPLLGLMLAGGGSRLNEHFKAVKQQGKSSRVTYLYLAVIGGIAIGAYLYVKSVFAGLGYVDN
jgi:hypothetical protein